MSPEADPPIIFIGGPSTAGKSTLARALAARLDARVVDTDLFWMALQRVEPPGHDIHLFHSKDVWSLSAEELLDRYRRVSRVVCQAVEAVVAHYSSTGVSAVIEGCWLLPEFAVRHDYAWRTIDAPVRALFLHEPSFDQLSHQLMTREDGWHARQPKAFQDAHALMQWQFGLEINRRAEALGLFILESRPFETLPDRALAALGLP